MILIGFIDDSTVQELLSECTKMKNFNHRHVITLKGVCIDGGPVPYIILPYMANGCLLTYLKKEQNSLVIVKDAGAEVGRKSDVSYENWYYPLCMLNRRFR